MKQASGSGGGGAGVGAEDLAAENAGLKERLLQLEARYRDDTETAPRKGEAVPAAPQPSSVESPSSASSSAAVPSSPLLLKAQSINSYWWPSAESSGGLLGKIHAAQNPTNCSARATRYFVWRSRRDSARDTRGLTAWAHAGASHLVHALTDGDQFRRHGSRVLVTDEKLWPMAKGCLDGPETRECYFEPLTRCKMSDVDDMGSESSHVLSNEKQEYDRSRRTVYTSNSLWFRITSGKYSWTGLPGGESEHSAIAMFAASFAYYFRPKPWLRKEIDERLRRSIPEDLNPERTIGVPIRRSDKCHGHNVTGSARGELDCPGLETYLEMVHKFVEFDPLIENVIVTSEEKSACDEFVRLLKDELPSLRVVLNEGDVQQGTGSGNKLESYVGGAANARVVASALTSMHLHLRARYFVITSKSTWTSTIAVMARVYGFAPEVVAIDIGRNKNAFAGYARAGCWSKGETQREVAAAIRHVKPAK
ncbi:hypothetical protein ACHAWF_011885 [Thalassiosira exigua]